MLLPYLRLAHCTDSESLRQASLDSCCSAPISAENELTVLHQLASHLQSCLARCACPSWDSASVGACSLASINLLVASSWRLMSCSVAPVLHAWRIMLGFSKKLLCKAAASSAGLTCAVAYIVPVLHAGPGVCLTR